MQTGLALLLAALGGAAAAALVTSWLVYRHVSGVARLLRRRDRQAAQRERLLAGVFEATSEGILIVDRAMRIVEVNRAFLAMSGYTREQLLGRHPRLMQSGRHDAAFYRAMWQRIAACGQWQGRVWDRRRDGSLFAAHLALSAVRDQRGELCHYLGLFTDITDECRRQEEVAQLAYTDALTGLPNRRLLQDRLLQALAGAARSGTLVAVCMLDLDGFKAVNDSFGHEAGDRVLRAVAERLLQLVRANDTVARLGGDEFVLVLGGLSEVAEAEEVLGRTLQAVRAPIALDGGGVARVSASIGMAVFPHDARLPDELLRRGDAAMYRAKRQGRDRCQRARSDG